MSDKQSTIKDCGIIMPIAAMPGYTSDHWQEVKSIIIEATSQIDGYNFKTEIVSNSDGEIDVIHKRIIQNLYNADIVICDISGKNPNVLFELGMRLTFDKPTILIKDDETDFIFDTGVIEHISYPKDLRFNKVVQFKNELATRIKQTYEKSLVDPNFSTFLRNFGTFKVPNLDQKTVTEADQLLFEELSMIRREIGSFKKEIAATKMYTYDPNVTRLKNIINDYIKENIDFDKPEEIIQKKEFISFLLLHGIDYKRQSTQYMRNYIKIAQDDNLPF